MTVRYLSASITTNDPKVKLFGNDKLAMYANKMPMQQMNLVIFSQAFTS